MKEMSIKVKNGMCKSSVFSHLKWYDYVIVIAVYIVLAILTIHHDVFHTVKSSYAILEGHLSDFYTYNQPIVGGNDYDVLVYLIFALWNLPMFLAGRATPWPATPAYIMLYQKILLVIFVLLAAWILYKICTKIGANKKTAFYSSFLFMTAPYLLLSTVAYGMYDIMYVFFMLWGLCFFIKDEKKYNVYISAL
ncbi:MAG: hypothetical protein RR193_06535, partial [Christensenellaceae bacterium]